MKIMLVDDERSALRDLERIVRHAEPQAEIVTAGSSAEALEICRQGDVHIAFLDIQLPEMDGLSLAKELVAMVPEINIIMVTGYSEYALDAFKVYASDFIVKPATLLDVRNALAHLRNPFNKEDKGLRIQCFGDFEVFYDGQKVRFGRSKAKELLAYLIDRKGAASNTNRICAALWETDNGARTKNHFRQIVSELRRILNHYDASDILIHSRDSFAIDTTKVNCDYYRFLDSDPIAAASYRGEYMSQYDWAEYTAASLHQTGNL